MDRAATALALLLIGMHAVEPNPVGSWPVWIEIGQGSHMSAAIPLFAGSDAGLTPDARIEVDY